MTYDPETRASAKQLLQHEYLKDQKLTAPDLDCFEPLK